jgi:hypothetical protein
MLDFPMTRFQQRERMLKKERTCLIFLACSIGWKGNVTIEGLALTLFGRCANCRV